jgi:dienelactone hydrolase
MQQEWISIASHDGGPNGDHYDAYLALPPAGRGPGLLLLQEIFGVNRHIRAVAEQYLQGQTIANKQTLEERDPVKRAERQAEMRAQAADPVRARKFLLRTAMLEGLAAAASPSAGTSCGSTASRMRIASRPTKWRRCAC